MPANTSNLVDTLDEQATHTAPFDETRLTVTVPETVNLHIWAKCNLRCTYCYGRFPARPTHMPAPVWCRILDLLAEAGVRRVTFSGGEPTLHPGLVEMLHHVRQVGLQASIITNGARLTRRHIEMLDLVAITVDSMEPDTLRRLGRGADYLDVIVRVGTMTHDAGRRLKVNTVVTQLNASEDLSRVIRALRPAKWKPLQFVHVPGENDDYAATLAVDDATFERFIQRHEALGSVLWLAPETARTVQTTYVMIDPAGRLFQHVGGRGDGSGARQGHKVSAPVLDVGLPAALASVGGYDRRAFIARGGAVDVRRLPVIGGAEFDGGAGAPHREMA